MKKDLLILVSVLTPAAFIMLLIANNFSSKRFTNPFALPTPYPTAEINAKSPTPEQMSITPASSTNIEVLAPLVGDVIKSGFIVKGNARVFENVVSIRLSDSEGNILVETTALANAPDVGEFGPFDKILRFETKDKRGILEVYQVSAKDGSEVDKVTIPIIFNQ